MMKHSKCHRIYDIELFMNFSVKFKETYVVPLLESHLQIVLNRKQFFIGYKCLNFALKFLSSSTLHATTMDKLRPYIESIMFENILPIIYITRKDVREF